MLIGGQEFEPVEENQCWGFGAHPRYYDDRYREGFHWNAWRCAASGRDGPGECEGDDSLLPDGCGRRARRVPDV